MDIENMRKNFEAGMTYRDMSTKYGVSTATVSNYKIKFGWNRKSEHKKVSHLNDIYQLVYSDVVYIDEDDTPHYKKYYKDVVIPKETMERLKDKEVYPFYMFISEDGQDLMIRLNRIEYIEKKIEKTENKP